MELNSLLFPSPELKWKPSDHYGDLIFVPKLWKNKRIYDAVNLRYVVGKPPDNSVRSKHHIPALRSILIKCSKFEVGHAPDPDGNLDSSFRQKSAADAEFSELQPAEEKKPVSMMQFQSALHSKSSGAPGPRGLPLGRNRSVQVFPFPEEATHVPNSSLNGQKSHSRHESNQTFVPSANQQDMLRQRYFITNSQTKKTSLSEKLAANKITFRHASVDSPHHLGAIQRTHTKEVEHVVTDLFRHKKEPEKPPPQIRLETNNIRFDSDNHIIFPDTGEGKEDMEAIPEIHIQTKLSAPAPRVEDEHSKGLDLDEEKKKELDALVQPTKMDKIPCLLLKPTKGSDSLIIYFHANGDEMNVLVVEYPGYGIYQSQETTEENILQDADNIFDFFTDLLYVKESRVLLMGRSIGTGPACYLASKHSVAGLILVSSFTGIKSVVKDYMGSVLQYLVKERFNNLERISKVKAPVLLIHGEKDTLVKPSHSEKLYGSER